MTETTITPDNRPHFYIQRDVDGNVDCFFYTSEGKTPLPFMVEELKKSAPELFIAGEAGIAKYMVETR